MAAVRVTYRFPAPSRPAAEAHADALLLEQSIETPRTVAARYPFVHEHLLGEVEAVEEVGPGAYRARLALPTYTAASDPAQLLNVLFGNASLHEGVELEDFALPPALTAGLGPAFGLDGLRARTGVRGRPLVASALKPAGLTPAELAALAHAFGLGGLDLVKDDHYLAAQPAAPFDARVPAVVAALDRAADATGHRTRYAPNVSGTPDDLLRQAEAAVGFGADALLVAPGLVGLPTLAGLRAFGLPLLAHPAFAGTVKAPVPLVQGRLFRLFGADAVIFAGYGGRFAVAPETCAALADEARRPWHEVRSALPTPAGGMTRERAAELVRFYGPDTMLLVGGSLLDAPDLAGATRALVAAVEAAAPDPPAPHA